MSKEDLYPELTEDGQKKAQDLIRQFNQAIEITFREAAERATSQFYTDVLPYIESDAWSNFRNQIIMGMSNYNNLAKHEAEIVRRSIINNHWDELKKDLDQDLVNENARLRNELNKMHDHIIMKND